MFQGALIGYGHCSCLSLELSFLVIRICSFLLILCGVCSGSLSFVSYLTTG
jgi:hypothetical protein